VRFGLWFASSGLSIAAFARFLGVDPSVVSRLLAGKRRPSLPLAVTIERKSEAFAGGSIKVSAWRRRKRVVAKGAG
jgi:transcriptional regulator with XRE-family HTH domain